MHFTSLLASLSLAALALAAPSQDLQTRSGSCKTPKGSGSCMSTSSCSGSKMSVPGYCPGPTDIQCCVESSSSSSGGSCTTPQGAGSCMSTSSCSGSKMSVPGFCPGPTDIQCCVEKSSTPPPSGGSGGGSGDASKGEALVNAAKKEEGLPYVWGGGGCAGASSGGFDCSGLTQYATCQAVGTTIPRTAQTQYSASSGKHIPRSQAQAGDLIFWASGGNCASGVDHVAIWMGSMRPNYILNAAHTGVPVREQPMWTSSGGLEVCPDAVRFW